jgi:molybdopterin synthase sulfur carrier subunit
MKVKVLFFASLREQLGRAAEELELPASVSTVAGLRAHLMARGGAWGTALADARRLRAAVNQDMAAPDAALRAGDEVAFFPPVTGG